MVEFEEECGVEGEASSSGGGSSASYDPLLPCLRVIRRRAQPQLRKYDVLLEGGVGVRDTSAAERAAGPLSSPALLSRVVAAGLEVAAAKGTPQDIEWCTAAGVLYLVQVSCAAAGGGVSHLKSPVHSPCRRAP